MRILIATNHSYMFYRFRKELVEALMQEHEVILSTPFVGHEDDLQAMGLRCIDTEPPQHQSLQRHEVAEDIPADAGRASAGHGRYLFHQAQYLYGHSLQG